MFGRAGWYRRALFEVARIAAGGGASISRREVDPSAALSARARKLHRCLGRWVPVCSRGRLARRRFECDFQVALGSRGVLVLDGFGHNLVARRSAFGSVPPTLEVGHSLVGVREAHVAKSTIRREGH